MTADAGSATGLGCSVLVPLKSRICRVWVSDRVIMAPPSTISDHRNASSSPRPQPLGAAAWRWVRMHQGPEADASTIACCAGVSAIAKCLFTRGGSLLVTGLAEINPHRIARVNAL